MEVIKIAFVGDIFPGGVLHGSTSKCVSYEVHEYLKKFDIRVGTLECALGNKFPFDEDKLEKWSNIIYAKDEDIRRIKEIGIDIVSLANNHTTDLGLDGLINTINLLNLNGILSFGAGKDIKEAEAPLVIKIRGKLIAFMSFYDTPIAPHPASEHRPGVCNSDNIINNIQKAKGVYDYVFVLPHWGFEYLYRVLPEDKKCGYRIIEAGADGVIGSHPHQIQPYTTYKKKPIFFSLANFLFPDFYQQPPCPIWYPDGSDDLETIPVVHKYSCNHKEYVKYVWEHKNRIGLIGELYISDKIRVKYKLTYLDENNKINFLGKTKKYVFILSILRFATRCPFYNLFYFLTECLFFIKRRFLLIKRCFKIELSIRAHLERALKCVKRWISE